MQGTAEWQETVLLGVFSLAFGGAGFGVLYAALTTQKKQKDRENRKNQYPKSPWMWRKDWAYGLIQHSSKSEMRLAWILSLGILLFSSVLVSKLYEEFIEQDNRVALVGPTSTAFTEAMRRVSGEERHQLRQDSKIRIRTDLLAQYSL